VFFVRKVSLRSENYVVETKIVYTNLVSTVELFLSLLLLPAVAVPRESPLAHFRRNPRAPAPLVERVLTVVLAPPAAPIAILESPHQPQKQRPMQHAQRALRESSRPLRD